MIDWRPPKKRAKKTAPADPEDGNATPVYGDPGDPRADEAAEEEEESIEIVSDDGDSVEAEAEVEETPATAELAGRWYVLSNGTHQIGVIDVYLEADGQSGKAQFRDAVTLLHTKFRMIPDPDVVLRCGPIDSVPAAPEGLPLVLADSAYAENDKFWRVKRVDGTLVWRKTVKHHLDESGSVARWRQKCDAHDSALLPGVFLAWTRKLPRGAGVRPVRPAAAGLGAR